MAALCSKLLPPHHLHATSTTTSLLLTCSVRSPSPLDNIYATTSQATAAFINSFILVLVAYPNRSHQAVSCGLPVAPVRPARQASNIQPAACLTIVFFPSHFFALKDTFGTWEVALPAPFSHLPTPPPPTPLLPPPHPLQRKKERKGDAARRAARAEDKLSSACSSPHWPQPVTRWNIYLFSFWTDMAGVMDYTLAGEEGRKGGGGRMKRKREGHFAHTRALHCLSLKRHGI